MLNIISFLLVLLIAIAGMRSGYHSNPLLSIGTLLVMGYILSLMMERMRLRPFFGYVLAGALAGQQGLDFIHDRFTDSLFLVENLCLMLVVSSLMRSVARSWPSRPLLRDAGAGAAATAGVMVLTTGFIAPLDIPFAAKLVFGLFAATFSPVLIHALGGGGTTEPRQTGMAVGGYVASIVLWGVTSSLVSVMGTDRIKLSAMPVIISATSCVAGFVWSHAADTMLKAASLRAKSLYPVAVMLLIYPFVKVAGLDMIFLAAGIGLHSGLMTTREETLIERSMIPLYIVGIFYGIRLYLLEGFLMDSETWSLTATVLAFLTLSRIVTGMAAARFIGRIGLTARQAALFLPSGPLAIILLRRFLPGFQVALGSAMSLATVYSVCVEIMLILLVLTSVFLSVTAPRTVSGIHGGAVTPHAPDREGPAA